MLKKPTQGLKTQILRNIASKPVGRSVWCTANEALNELNAKIKSSKERKDRPLLSSATLHHFERWKIAK